MITIPSQTDKTWRQLNIGDVFGDLYSTRNASMDNNGYVTLGKRAICVHSEAVAAPQFADVLSIVYSSLGNTYYYITNIGIFSGLITVTQNVTAGVPTPSLNGDGIMYNNLLYVTTDTTTHTWNNTAWSNVALSLTTGHAHPQCVFESLTYRAVGDANTVKLYNTSNSLINTLTLPAEYSVTWLVYRDSNLYVGTKNLQGREAKMFVWNGSGSAAQKAYGAKGSEWMYSGAEYNNSIATITDLGQLLIFNGGGFTELANLPVYYTNYKWWDTGYFNNGRVARRGMIADGNNLKIVIDGQIAENPFYLDNQPSGLWVFDPESGLYNSAGASTDLRTSNTITNVDTTTDVITVTSAVDTSTGMPVFFTAGGGSITGLSNNRIYYAIRVTSTTFKLALTQADAIAGTAIDLTGSSLSSTILYMHRGADFGESGLGFIRAGAIALIRSRASFSFFGSNVLYGIGYASRNTTTDNLYTLQSLGLGENRGTIVTSKKVSGQVEDTFQKIFLKARGLFKSIDKVIVKYRLTEEQFLPKTNYNQVGDVALATWASTTSFTVIDAGWANVNAGDEVTILSGSGAGYTAHISTISNVGTTYTVVLDETLPLVAVSDTAYVSVDNWTKGVTITSSDTSFHKENSVAKSAKWLQIKLELRGDKTQVEELQIANKTQLPIA